MCCKSCWGTGDFSLVSVPALGVGGVNIPPMPPRSSTLFFMSFFPVASLNKMLYRLTWLSSFLPFPFLSLCNLSALSLTSNFDFYLSDPLSSASSRLSPRLSPVNAQYSCVVSHRERSILSFIFHYSWALNSPHNHWHILRQMQLFRLLFSSPLKAFFKIPSTNEEKAFTCIHTFFMSLTYIPHKSALNKDKEIVERYAYR